MKNELYHHGIKGQKWGVRRFQNKDGTLTAEGRQRLTDRRRSKVWYDTAEAVEKIYRSMTKDEKRKLTGVDDEPPERFSTPPEAKNLVKRVLKEVGCEPMAFCDIWDTGSIYAVAIGVANREDARGKGYGTEVAKTVTDWYKRYGKADTLVWSVREDNKGSIRIAEKSGFKRVEDENYRDDLNYVWRTYSLNKKKKGN
jgi:RimJ/RimL family protein N-acetyltransferase